MIIFLKIIFLNEFRLFVGDKNIIVNIYRIQGYDSTLSGHFCSEFVDFMLNDKSLTDTTNLFPSIFKKMIK